MHSTQLYWRLQTSGLIARLNLLSSYNFETSLDFRLKLQCCCMMLVVATGNHIQALFFIYYLVASLLLSLARVSKWMLQATDDRSSNFYHGLYLLANFLVNWFWIYFYCGWIPCLIYIHMKIHYSTPYNICIPGSIPVAAKSFSHRTLCVKRLWELQESPRTKSHGACCFGSAEPFNFCILIGAS